MRTLTLAQLADWSDAMLLGDGDRRIEAIDIDSRAVRADSLFVALVGERHDGHDHAAQALANGAVALLVSRPLETDAPQLVCGNTQVALGRIAAGMAATRATKIIAITGSNGKTTVKSLTHQILTQGSAGTVGAAVGGEQRHAQVATPVAANGRSYSSAAAATPPRIYANPGNRNNEIGLPLALIEQPEDTDIGIYEMGAGQPGDIAYLTDIARPHIALVNNVAPAHLERMGSLLGVAETKGAIYGALRAGGTAVVNADDAFATWFEEWIGDARVLRFAMEASADVRAEHVHSDPDGSRFELVTADARIDIALPLPGRHNVMNALAAATLSLAAGASLAQVASGLASASAVAGRLLRHTLASGALLFDDSYNANPGSVGAAISTLATHAAAGRETWLVLGDMKELGADAERLHAEVGERARAAGIARLFTTGPLSAAASRAFAAGAQHFDDKDALIDVLRAGLSSQVVCLVKGSRSSAMERVVDALLPGAQPARVHGGGHAA